MRVSRRAWRIDMNETGCPCRESACGITVMFAQYNANIEVGRVPGYGGLMIFRNACESRKFFAILHVACVSNWRSDWPNLQTVRSKSSLLPSSLPPVRGGSGPVPKSRFQRRKPLLPMLQRPRPLQPTLRHPLPTPQPLQSLPQKARPLKARRPATDGRDAGPCAPCARTITMMGRDATMVVPRPFFFGPSLRSKYSGGCGALAPRPPQSEERLPC